MKRTFTALLCSMICLLSITATEVVADTPQLRQDGRWLVDQHNRVVITHGMNTIWKKAPYYPPNTAEGFTAADAQWLKNHGFNSARVGTLFVGVMPERNQIDNAYLDEWDRVIQLLADNEIWIMFDFHQDMYHEEFSGEGFPDWSVYDEDIPLLFDLGFPINYIMGPVKKSYDNLWANTDNLWDSYQQAWMAVAEKWQDQPYNMGYDLMNEPFPGNDFIDCVLNWGCKDHDLNELQAFQTHMLNGIRQVDANNIVWYESQGPAGFGIPSALGEVPVEDDNIGYSFHNYCALGAMLHQFGINDVPGCDWLEKVVFRQQEAVTERLNSTWLLSEFGASDDLPDIENLTQLSDEHLVGWQYWHYKEWKDPTTESQDTGAQGLFTDDADLSTVKEDKLKILARTYPQYTAGIPQELNFDPENGDFYYCYTPREASAPTVVYVPTHVHYPDGYELTINGGDLIRVEEERWLHIENHPNVSEVTITIEQ